MSSEETDESLKYDLSKNVSKISNDVIKCLTEPQFDAKRNEIPCCSNNVSISVVDTSGLELDDTDNQISIVIEASDADEGKIGTNCDNVIPSVGSSQNVVPVSNELMTRESQKLVSLSLSILLAALLQAMRCFAQFLEDIVVPQR
ncbi:uncharacterized protein LOC134667915 [Cydia fagiglandana]|uniref:uncharacterized protein LOC134667915 n=1 Tax=Cydia fagiglandana TaxID=1458189 RepID=UPI002FEE2B25